ncbi:DNA glycosylase [Gonapodya prolifera JEL478]|uniref:DNA-(apurinic or apyrimidinic site) lyase n=1 Tax=Gonapodya prolifera (strain JEL478) TaxID=1344416 RepID=A0A139A3K4_GONPJ|nr:DNA glycosylase [Gonapodya prolifera JEL478]|eukprot:KXS11294.1 DNA glycosylase [Gonapodya prolifera JEL478]
MSSNESCERLYPTPWASLNALPEELRLDTTLHGAQSFRWRKTEESEWTNVLDGKLVSVKQTDNDVLFRTYKPREVAVSDTSKDSQDLKSYLRDYFQLDTSLQDLYTSWATADPNFRRVGSQNVAFRGIRVLRQHPVENLITFICTSNNNVARITLMVNALCREYGPAIGVPSHVPEDEPPFHDFPVIKTLSATDDLESRLRELGFGYRAKYITQTCARLSEHPDPEAYLLSLRALPYKDAIQALLEFPGVGPKVADCVALMSLDKREAVPVDRHVWQIALRDYGFTMADEIEDYTLTPKVYRQIQQHFRSLHGEYCGWAHSVLFTADLRAFNDRINCELGGDIASPSKTPKKRK